MSVLANTVGSQDPSSNLAQQIEQSADFYQPAVYELLEFYQALEIQGEPLDGQFIPLTTAQPWEQARTLVFAVGFIPPSSNVTGRLLDRSASVRAFEEQNYEELLKNNPDVGSSSTGDLPGETSGVSTSTTIPIGPTESGLTDDFWVQYVVMCNRLGCQPEELARVIQSESGFDPGAVCYKKDRTPGARGLIQLIHDTAVGNPKRGRPGLGMTEDEYANLQNTSAISQLKWVERYYGKKAKGKNAFELKATTIGGFNNPDGSIYNSNAKPPEFKEPEVQKRNYLANQQFDKPPPPKGYITPEDVKRRLAKRMSDKDFKDAIKKVDADISKARRKVGMATGYEAFQPDGFSSGEWATSGASAANTAFKTAWLVANKDLNQTNLGKMFTAQQQAMINQTVDALDKMAKTPPLRLLINPQSFRVSAEKLISDGNWTRNGPIIEHWGDNQDRIEGSGKIAAFYSLDALEGNSPGLSRTARQFSASYQNLLSLWLIYKNNGGIWFPDPMMPEGSRAKNLSVLGSVYLYYDGILYIGSFDNFNLDESETTPFSLEYSFSFTVRAWFILDHLDDSQYTYGKPTVPSLSVGSSTPPLTGEQEQQYAFTLEEAEAEQKFVFTLEETEGKVA